MCCFVLQQQQGQCRAACKEQFREQQLREQLRARVGHRGLRRRDSLRSATATHCLSFFVVWSPPLQCWLIKCAGIGHIVETLESSDYSVDTVEGVEERSRILLSWGAQLFSAETFKVRKVFENIEALSYQTAHTNSSSGVSGSGGASSAAASISTELLLQLEEWNQSAAAKMTSMV